MELHTHTQKKKAHTRTHTVQITQKALGPAAKTSQNSLVVKELRLSLVRNTQAADKPTQKCVDNSSVQDLVATEA